MVIAAQQSIRRFGAPPGAPGIEVIERSGGNALSDPRYGTAAVFMNAKRGPMNVPIPVNSRRQYDEVFGDPRDPRWHLYPSGAHLGPDFVDGFYTTGGGAGQLWVTRIDLDGKARKAKVVIKNRLGVDALEITAANEGRWGGRKAELPVSPVVVSTARTFTIVAPGVLSNEYAEAEAEFTANPGRRYRIIANTEAHPRSGEVVFTVGMQYDLILDGVQGPALLTGLASYDRYTTLSGIINFALLKPLTGTISIANDVLTGTGTQFTTQLVVGQNIYYNNEARVVRSITSNTTATIDAAFTTPEAVGVTMQVDNLDITGTGTAFTTELQEGDNLYVQVGEVLQTRKVAAIATDTTLTLESGFTTVIANSESKTDNYTVVGVGTSFLTQLAIGQKLIDPNRGGESVTVLAVTDDTHVVVDRPFPGGSFANAQLTRQTLFASVYLDQPIDEGLTVEIGQGTRYPDTHFSMQIRFNESLVLTIPDASLDPDDEYFVEPIVNDSNIAYRTGATNYQKWITARSLWTSAYTVVADADVRPCNGSGTVLVVTPDKLYTIGEFDYDRAKGGSVYPNPYAQARNFFRIKNAVKPINLEGTISSNGVLVTGTSTNFSAIFKPGDYLYAAGRARKVKAVIDDNELTLESGFTSNLPGLTLAKKVGYLQVEQAYDLTVSTRVNDRFLAVFPTPLAGGYDGDTSRMIPYYFAKYADPDLNILENATFGRNLGLIRMACPGISDITVQKAFANYASQRAYEFRAELPSYLLTAASAESFVNQELGRNDFISCAFPSYGFVSSPLGSGDRMISLSGDIIGGESAYSVSAEGYHRPFAGVNAILPRVLKLPVESTPAEDSITNVAGLQAIKIINGNVVVFGARVPSISPTYDFLHIRRIQSNYIRIFLEARTLLELLFLPNQPSLSEQIVMILNNFSRREYRKGVFTQYLSFAQAVQVEGATTGAVISDSEGSDALVEIINGKLRIYFRYVPTGILEKLSINAGPDILVSQYGNTINQSSI